jgi:hypothetical protein
MGGKMKIKKATKLRAARDLPAKGLTYWKAPYTGGFRCVVPEGTVVIVRQDVGPFSLGVTCVPEDYEGFGEKFVPENDRRSPKYAGYSLFFWRWQLGRRLRVLAQPES